MKRLRQRQQSLADALPGEEGDYSRDSERGLAALADVI
jgi:hypothetical protein